MGRVDMQSLKELKELYEEKLITKEILYMTKLLKQFGGNDLGVGYIE